MYWMILMSIRRNCPTLRLKRSQTYIPETCLLPIIVLLLRDRVQVVPPTDSKSGGDKPPGPEAHCKTKRSGQKTFSFKLLHPCPRASLMNNKQ